LTNRFFHLTIVALVASCFVHAQTTPQQSEFGNAAPSHGEWWLSLTAETKDKYIEHYAKVTSELARECLEDLKCQISNRAAECGNGVDLVDPRYLRLSCQYASSIDDPIFGITHKELREGVDEFYKDSANLAFPVGFALEIVREKQGSQKSLLQLYEKHQREHSKQNQKSGETPKQE
jgi:hypothetical protein